MENYVNKNIEPANIKSPVRNKSKYIIFQILFMIVVSCISVLFILDIVYDMLGSRLFSMSCFLIMPILFAFPIVIKKPIMLFIPYIVFFVLTFIIILLYGGVIINGRYIHPNLLSFYYSLIIFLAMTSVSGIVTGFIIKTIKKKSFAINISNIILSLTGIIILLIPLFLVLILYTVAW